MIYLIQPFLYDSKVARKIKQFLKEQYPHQTLTIRHSYPKHMSNKDNHLYFIINDTRLKAWDGLNLSQEIRRKETKASIVLISNTLDYQSFFRSHVGFLGVIDLNHLDDIEGYLNDCLMP